MSQTVVSCRSAAFTAMAVQLTDANLCFGSGEQAVQALSDVSLKVPEGIIYGLFGPSGSGKTTLISSIVGRIQLTQGQVKVFGVTPGSKDSHVPGRWVGYMPQELALYLDFTIEEMLTYFGRLHRVDSEKLKKRTDFLLNLLELPTRKRVIGNLSGGQKRRVSFAVALIHSPPLLILDEPTVGLDPMLRQSMWNYLIKLTSFGGMTVIITTHYIEEARQANLVGMMREGRLLASGSPDVLIKTYKACSLEDCFLKLCFLDSAEILSGFTIHRSKQVPETSSPIRDNQNSRHVLSKCDLSSSFKDNSYGITKGRKLAQLRNRLNDQEDLSTENYLSATRIKVLDNMVTTMALASKNLTRLKRNHIMVVFQFVIPVIQVTLVCLCIGRPLIDLPLAVVNRETEEKLGWFFLQKLDTKTIHQISFVDLKSAIQSVKDGLTWGALEIGPDFSSCLVNRYSSGLAVDNAIIDGSSISVYLDETNEQVAMTLRISLLASLQEFASEVL